MAIPKKQTRGRIKVIVDAQGNTKIQEELNGNIRIWTANEWGKEQLRRRSEQEAKVEAPESEESEEEEKSDDEGDLIQEDTDDDE